MVVDWNYVYALCKQVANKIMESGYDPDLIVALARGGWFAGRVLCDLLGVKDLVSLKVEHWGITATPDGEARIRFPLNLSLEGRKVLVVDDITDTGKSLKVATSHLRKLNPKELRTATLQCIRGSEFRPDYFAEEIDWVWVVYPWNFYEDMRNLIPPLFDQKDVLDVNEIRELLLANHEIELDLPTIIDVLKHMEQFGLVTKVEKGWKIVRRST